MWHSMFEVNATETRDVIVDYTCNQPLLQSFDIRDFSLIQQGQDESAFSFRLIPDRVLTTLLTAQPLNFNFHGCQSQKDATRLDYTLYGLSAYIYEQKNVSSSITYGLRKITKLKLKKFDIDGNPVLEEYESLGCGADRMNAKISFEINGLVSQECISDDVGGVLDTQIPTQCSDDGLNIEDSVNNKKFLENYKHGQVRNASNNIIKEFLTRTGIIQGDIIYYNDMDEQIGQETDVSFIGWDKDSQNKEQWIIARKNYFTTTYEDFYLTEERIPFRIKSASYAKITGNAIFKLGQNQSSTSQWQSCGIASGGGSQSGSGPVTPGRFKTLKYRYASGVVTIDRTSEDTDSQYFNLADTEPYEIDAENVQQMMIIKNGTFDVLQPTQFLGFDSKKCSSIDQFRYDNYLYALLGYACFTYEGIDMSPSIYYLSQNTPQQVRVIPDDIQSVFVEKGCDAGFLNVVFSAEINGIVSDSCIPNNGNWTNMNKCVNGSVPVKHLEGFQFGFMKGVANQRLKMFLTRFGAFRGDLEWFNRDIFNVSTSVGEAGRAIFLGWDVDQQGQEVWVVARQNHQTLYKEGVPYRDFFYEIETVPFLVDGANVAETNIYFVYVPGKSVIPQDMAYQQIIEEGEQSKDACGIYKVAFELIVAVLTLPIIALLFSI
ncbi:MAG: hypothetical protein EZS28_006048 [Streblomastix strix]|uniref:Uncharacterized protein n=1 Tax=Streblomastix strix TaxID=222440 RepID=A0A5J4WUF2_9EUKA|nr:MAG: hypothetical protein EZS28_006048 [Streblomastix strix]